MKLVITEKEQGTIIAKQTVIKLEVNPFSSDAGKLPMSLFEVKGDLVSCKGAANPVRIAVGSDGQVLVADSNAESGMRWKVMTLGTVTLRNHESVAVTAGTVVTTTGVPVGYFRIAAAADTQNLFVAAENILSGQLGVIYNASGKDCNVKVTDGAVTVGDKLTVSSTDGVAVATTGADYFAQAITSKAAGAHGTVICVLVNTVNVITPISGGGTGSSTVPGALANLEIFDHVYPVGSIYMSVNSTNPSTLFGGTWQTWGTGRVPVGIDISDSDFDDAGKTGGAKSHSHDLSSGYALVTGGLADNRIWFKRKTFENWNANYQINGSGASGSSYVTPQATELQGNSQPESTLQPYIVCYMWVRTA